MIGFSPGSFAIYLPIESPDAGIIETNVNLNVSDVQSKGVFVLNILPKRVDGRTTSGYNVHVSEEHRQQFGHHLDYQNSLSDGMY